MDKRFWGVIAAIAVIFVGIVIVNNRNADPAESGGGQPTSHIKGEGQDKVTLVEYGDFQCPVCQSYYPSVETVAETYKSDINFQFRHFPLQQIHKNALAASRAAEAADKQGKFWEMYALLYQNQDPNGQSGWVGANDPLNEYFTGFASQLNLKVDQFKQDFASESVNRTVNADIAEGNKLKVTGTPAFFLDGKLIELKDLVGDDGRPSVDKLSKLIEDAIKAKGGTPNPVETTGDAGASSTEPAASTEEQPAAQ